MADAESEREADELKEQALLLASLKCDDSIRLTQKRVIPHELTGPRSKRRKRAQISPPEHVCFVCLGDGELVRCSIMYCTKAYHPSCIGQDSDAFQRKEPWFCGWHFCTHCSRPATMHCYTCSNAICNTCTKATDFLCLRENKGLCDSCFQIVKIIENGQDNINGVQVDLNDKEAYEYLYKDYWENLKSNTYLTWEEIEKAQKGKESGELLMKSSYHNSEQNDGSATDSDGVQATKNQFHTKGKRLNNTSDADYDASESESESESESDYSAEGDEEEDDDIKPKKGLIKKHEFDGWATRELLDFLQLGKENINKRLSLSAVNKLVLSYIKDNKISQRRGQIVCDEKLQKIFGRKIVDHSEMMNLLSSHIACRRNVDKNREAQTAFDDSFAQVEERWAKGSNEKQRKLRKKLDETKIITADPNDFAAINVNNINLLYLRRALLENLLNDSEFNSKVTGAFVRIRVPGMANKNDACHRLVKVVGIKFLNPVNSVAKMADVVLEVLNLQKREEVLADLISNQDFTEEECQRLRQCIKCGFIKAMKVGEMEEKARSLQEVKFKCWFDAELRRLSHLRDRASEKGHKRELRECLEKLQLLCSPEENERRLKESLQITGDAHMDPAFESDVEDTLENDKQENASSDKRHTTNRILGIAEKSPKHWDNSHLNEVNVSSGLWDNAKIKSFAWGQKNFSREGGYKDGNSNNWFPTINSENMNTANHQKMALENINRNSDFRRNKHRDADCNNFLRSVGASDRGFERNETTLYVDGLSGYGRGPYGGTSLGDTLLADQKGSRVETAKGASTLDVSNPAAIDEKENIWHYRDPTGKIQGPFSVEQLRKWEKTKLFPLDLKVWKIAACEDDSILLIDVLTGKHFLPSTSLLKPTAAVGNDPYTGCHATALGEDLKDELTASMTGNEWREQPKADAWNEDEMAKASSQNACKDYTTVDKLWECASTEASVDRRTASISNMENKYDLNVAAENFTSAEARGLGKVPEYGGCNMSKFATEDSAQGSVESRTSRGRDCSYYMEASRYWNDRPRPDFRTFRRKDIPCKYFARGSCKKGVFCDFRHTN